MLHLDRNTFRKLLEEKKLDRFKVYESMVGPDGFEPWSHSWADTDSLWFSWCFGIPTTERRFKILYKGLTKLGWSDDEVGSLFGL